MEQYGIIMYTFKCSEATMRKYKSVLYVLVLMIPFLLEYILQGSLNIIDYQFAIHHTDFVRAAFTYTQDLFRIINAVSYAAGLGFITLLLPIYVKDQKNVLHYIYDYFKITLFITLIAMVLGIVFHKPILYAFGATISVMPSLVPYYVMNMLSLPFLVLAVMMASYYHVNFKFTKAMLAFLIGAIVNLIGNFLFGQSILLIGFITLCSRIIIFMILAYGLSKDLGFSFISVFTTRINKGLCKKILYFSGIPSIDRLINRIGAIIFYIMTFTAGIDSYRAYQHYGAIEKYSFIPIMLIGGIFSISITLQHYRQENSADTLKQGVWLSFFFSSLFGIALLFLASDLATTLTSDPSIYDATFTSFILLAFIQPFVGIPSYYYQLLKLRGDVITPFFTNFIGTWGIRLPLCYILTIFFHLGLLGVFIAYSVDVIFKFIYIRYRYHTPLTTKQLV